MAEVGSYTFLVSVFRKIISPEFSVDDFCFRLHHHYTVRFLAITVFMSFLYKLLDPITCFTLNKDFPSNVLNSYCLMQNTYTLPDAIDKRIGSEVAFQGVDVEAPDAAREYQRFYQWVPVVLLMQAMLFNLPYYLWETKERKNIKGLVLNMNKPLPVSVEQVKMVGEHLVETRGNYRRFASWYLVCSLLNLLNVCLQLVFTNMFVGGELMENGWHILERVNENYNERTDRMVAIFPRVTKCTFNQFGVGGDVQRYDAMCVMPFNFFYEWVFVFNISWFVLVAVTTLWYVVGYLGSFASCRFQFFLVSFPCMCHQDWKLKRVLETLDFGHRFVLIMLRSRLSMVHFEKLVEQLEKQLKVAPVDNDDNDNDGEAKSEEQNVNGENRERDILLHDV